MILCRQNGGRGSFLTIRKIAMTSNSEGVSIKKEENKKFFSPLYGRSPTPAHVSTHHQRDCMHSTDSHLRLTMFTAGCPIFTIKTSHYGPAILQMRPAACTIYTHENNCKHFNNRNQYKTVAASDCLNLPYSNGNCADALADPFPYGHLILIQVMKFSMIMMQYNVQ